MVRKKRDKDLNISSKRTSQIAEWILEFKSGKDFIKLVNAVLISKGITKAFELFRELENHVDNMIFEYYLKDNYEEFGKEIVLRRLFFQFFGKRVTKQTIETTREPVKKIVLKDKKDLGEFKKEIIRQKKVIVERFDIVNGRTQQRAIDKTTGRFTTIPKKFKERFKQFK